MIIKYIEFKNFNSYSNKLQRIDFDINNQRLYLVSGKNGSGKSTISDVIKFSLYGKVKGKKINDLVNRINGGLYTKICFLKNNNEIIIERGVDPTFTKLYINGDLYDLPDKRDIQKYIEDEILKIDSSIFNNTISLSINDFKSFVTMTPNEKRNIIDKIFGLELLNFIIKDVRGLLNSNLQKFDNTNIVLDNINQTFKIYKKQIDDLVNEINNYNNFDKDLLLKDIQTLKDEYNKTNNDFNEFNNKKTELDGKLSDLNTKLIALNKDLKIINDRLNLYKNKTCPYCLSDLTDDKHVNLLNDLNNQKNILNGKLNKGNELLNKIKTKISEYNNTLKEFGSKLNELNKKITELNLKINKNDEDKKLKIEQIDKMILEHKNLYDLNNYKINIIDNKIKFLKKVDNIIGDNGFKSFLIKSIIPSLNNIVNGFLNDMGVDFKIYIDELFNVNVYYLGEVINYDTLSSGERKKLDFSILLSIIELIKMKILNINLIFLDEIFYTIDQDSINDVLLIIKNYSKKYNLNIFLVSHSYLPLEYFDYRISVTKESGFSSLSVDKVY